MAYPVEKEEKVETPPNAAARQSVTFTALEREDERRAADLVSAQQEEILRNILAAQLSERVVEEPPAVPFATEQENVDSFPLEGQQVSVF